MFKKMIVTATILGTLLGFGGGIETASAAPHPHSFHRPPGHHQHFNPGCVRLARRTYKSKSSQISKYNPEKHVWKCGRDNKRGNYQSVPRPGSHRRLHR